jgi:hypothetical protein
VVRSGRAERKGGMIVEVKMRVKEEKEEEEEE